MAIDIKTPDTYNQALVSGHFCGIACKPNGVRASVEDNYILLTWNEPASNGGCVDGKYCILLS